jgi:hypothetical protein
VTHESSEPARIYFEVGKKRVFACAVDWPGWCRSGRNEELAIEALSDSAPRYAVVAREANVPFPADARTAFDTVERLPGDATTDFGAPGKIATSDTVPVTREEAERLAALVTASWRVFDRVVAGAPAELRKGPRGGGRDRDKIVAHILGAEASYARMMGIRHSEPGIGDVDAIRALRDAITDALRNARSGAPLREKGWPPRYAARRIAWHVIDHAWEIEDRSELS